ncbi:DUF6090 family protein [Winogradskyella alexanderae]|uniref:Uncharacterized protein n=1 Tax=Winogradskyella alexanderae TaxID=2877123 RepID=A0ABS7XUV4_9FLAO|nr:DUF6090 family protein [Winogradskyella alexanderae]MCA0133801.1 hypothetical protein [Winogradskyella alexanderae]
MIKFFRHIRKSLLSENKFSKYLIYAIGEIALVMIGILLALQVNNWNENRKAEEKELKLLIELKDDLIETKKDLMTDIERIPQLLNITNALYKSINEGKISETDPFKLPQGYLLVYPILYPKLSAYEAIQSEGISIISNDKLRKEITDFYQLHLNRVAWAEEKLEELNNKVLKPYLIANSAYGSGCKDCADLYELLRTNKGTRGQFYILSHVDDELVHMLKDNFNWLNVINRRYLALSETIDDMIVLIDQETNFK